MLLYHPVPLLVIIVSRLTSLTDGLGYLLRARLNGTCLDLRRNWGEYPAIKLKLYIQDVEAALNTLHLQETCPIIGYGRVLY